MNDIEDNIKEILELPPTDCQKLSNKLTVPQIKAAVLLASGVSGRDTCSQVGIHYGTLFVWKKNPDFEEFVLTFLDHMLTYIQIKHTPMLSNAFDTLNDIINADVVTTELKTKAKVCNMTIEKLHKNIELLISHRQIMRKQKQIEDLLLQAEE